MEISQFLEELDPEFLESLYKLDEREAIRVQLEGCPRCGGQLDRADYWRKPRGVSGLERHLSRGASIETISRWQHWWEEVVAEHPLWRFWRGRFVPPLGTRQIVRSMFDRFSSVASSVSETVHRVSKFLSPLTF